MVKKMLEGVQNTSLRVKTAVAVGGASALSCALPVVAHAAEGDAASGVSEAVSAVSSVMGLFSQYPMNVLLGCGIAIAAFRVFRSGKQASN